MGRDANFFFFHQNKINPKESIGKDRGTVRVMATMCRMRDHTGDSGSVIRVTGVAKEKLACAILAVAPNSNQMGSRVSIIDTSIVGDYRKYT